MKLLLSISLFLLTTTAFAEQSDASESNSLATLIKDITLPEPIERVDPKYPPSAARQGQEGWVVVNFVVDTEGRVKSPTVVESSGVRSMEREVLRAVKKWRYAPATIDGEAIERCQNSIKFELMLGGDRRGVTRRFLKRWKKASGLVKQGKLAEARAALDEMASKNMWNLSENDWYWFLSSQYYRQTGDVENELSSLNKAFTIGRLSASDIGLDAYLAMRKRQFALSTESGDYLSALKLHDLLKKDEEAKQLVEELETYAQKIVALIESDDPLWRSAEISSRGLWQQQLVRNAFSISDVEGSLDSVDIRCENRQMSYTAAPDSQWTIPKKWGRCTVMVFGEEGSQFKLIEVNGA